MLLFLKEATEKWSQKRPSYSPCVAISMGELVLSTMLFESNVPFLQHRCLTVVTMSITAKAKDKLRGVWAWTTLFPKFQFFLKLTWFFLLLKTFRLHYSRGTILSKLSNTSLSTDRFFQKLEYHTLGLHASIKKKLLMDSRFSFLK